MVTIKEAAQSFLACRRIAVTGVSREHADHGANNVYKRLRDRGYEVFAVNPNADTVEGDRAYHRLADIPDGIEAVVIGTSPAHTEETVRECNDLGIKQVWMHRGPVPGSVCAEATVFGREHGMTVIDGGCPLMFDPTADVGHKVMRFVLTRAGKIPKRV